MRVIMEGVQLLCLCFWGLLLCPAAMAATPKKPVDMPFHVNYAPSWSAHHIQMFHGGRKAEILLDKQSGAGFESKGTYLFGHFSMQIKLVGGDSAGTVTAFYVMPTGVKHRDLLGDHPSQYYSSLSVLNYGVSSMVKPTLLATPFAKPSSSVVPYEPFIRKPLKLIN